MAKTTPRSKKGSPNPASASDLQELEQLFKLMGKHQIAEVEFEDANRRIHVRTPSAFVAQGMPVQTIQHASMPVSAPVSASPSVPASAPSAASSKGDSQLASNQKQILSPFVGTFYRSPSPDSEMYVKEGQTIKRGDVLCIIEAMKLMNEIEAEIGGKIVSILVENGQPVEFGEPLFLVET